MKKLRLWLRMSISAIISIFKIMVAYFKSNRQGESLCKGTEILEGNGGLAKVLGDDRQYMRCLSRDPHQIIKRPAASWYGGEWVLGKWIIEYLPSQKIYIEPFSGMWPVGSRKPASKIEVYDGLHKEAVKFWVRIRDHPQELISLIESTYSNKELYDSTYHIQEVESSLLEPQQHDFKN